jgi:hypothetical protein
MPTLTKVNFRKTRNYVLPPVSERMRTGYADADFSAAASYEYDLALASQGGEALVIQSLTVDNSNNDAAVTVYIDRLLQYKRVIQAGQISVFNVPAMDPSYLKLESAGTGVCRFYPHNFPSLPDSQYVTATGGATTAPDFTQTAPEVTNASAQILAANSDRVYLLIQNNDPAGNVYINFGADATAAHLKIPAGGGSFEVNGNAPGQAINLIGDIASNTNIVVIEG